MNGDQAMRAHSATLPGPVFDDPAWVTPKSLSESTVAIVTSAALYVSDDEAFSTPASERAASMQAICMPKQMPK